MLMEKSISQPLQKGKERFHLQGIYQSKTIIQYEKKELPLHKTVIWGTIQHSILYDGVTNKWVLLVLFFW